MLQVPQQFAGVLDADEHLVWSGCPTAIPFFIGGVPLFVFGIIWGFIDLGFISTMSTGISVKNASLPALLAGVGFFTLHLFPLWLGVGNMIRLFLVYGNTFYGLTNKRIMLRSGFWGTDFKSIDYDGLKEMEVTVNPIENMLGVGSIRFFTGRTGQKGAPVYDRFIGIADPYAVYKQLKQVSMDIKTDWNYPNALRPDTNPGYRTTYDRK